MVKHGSSRKGMSQLSHYAGQHEYVGALDFKADLD